MDLIAFFENGAVAAVAGAGPNPSGRAVDLSRRTTLKKAMRRILDDDAPRRVLKAQEPGDGAGVAARALPALDAVILPDMSDRGRARLESDGATLVENTRVRLVEEATDGAPVAGIRGRADAAVWHLDFLGIDPAARSHGRGEGVTVGVLDTGCAVAHPEFDPERVLLARARYDQVAPVEPTEGDAHGHGTAVCALIAGRHVGVAPAARLVVCDVFRDPPYAELVDITLGLNWLLDRSADSGDRIHVLNMSLTARVPDMVFQRAIRRAARRNDILLVAAAGNGGTNAGPNPAPGDYPECFAIGACDRAGAAAGFTDWGVSAAGMPKPDLWAPGAGVISARATGGHVALDGTSFAAPLAAGVAALHAERNRRMLRDARAWRRCLGDRAATGNGLPGCDRLVVL